MLSLILPIFFDSDLATKEISSQKPSISIIIDDIYCKDCLETVFKMYYLWGNRYDTYLLIRSSKKKDAVKYYQHHFKKRNNMAKILFFDKNKKDVFPEFSFGNMKFNASPTILIQNDSSFKVILYNELFSTTIDSVRIKQILKKSLKF